MAIRIETNAEPIPGYRLIERLGGGGFGEVWKAEAPGGFSKAIKFVYGLLDSNDEDAARAEQEERALKRITQVRHAFILSLERMERIEGQLLLIMELADRTLWDRFRECRSQGLLGIPRKELLGYLKETAEALDFMYTQFQLLHLDVKPQNLFLVNTHIKVADFGLAKNLSHSAASITGGVTPVYAAPETFDGEGRRSTDQYSLAIVYQEMLTGQRPFTGTTARQLVLQHLQAEPDLSTLPPGDQTILRKALSKDYRDRYPSCLAFVQALETAAERPPAPAGPAGEDLPAPKSASPTNGFTTEGRPGTAAPSTASPPLPLAANGATAQDRPKSQLLECLTAVPPSVRHPGSSAVEDTDTDRPGLFPETPHSVASGELRPGATGRNSIPLPPSTVGSLGRSLPSEGVGDGILLPALVIGIGSVGQAALKQLRRQIYDQFGAAGSLPQLRFLYLDSDPEAMALAGRGGEAALQPQETLLTRLHRASHYLKPREGTSVVQSWLPARMLYRIPRQLVPQGVRALGRLAFVDNFGAIRRRVEAELHACAAPEARAEAEQWTGLGVAAASPRVYVVTSLAGGTGSGMFIDVGYTVRTLLKEAGVANPDVVAVLLLPTTESNAAQTPALANTFAALTELEHFGQPGTVFSASYGGKDERGAARVSTQEPPFRRCLLIPAEDAIPSADELKAAGLSSAAEIGRAASVLFTELCTPLGREADRERRKWVERQPRLPDGTRGRMVFQTADLVRIHWPIQQILHRAAVRLCGRLVEHWMNKDARPLRDSIRQWVQKQWADLDLSANQLIDRLQLSCQQALGQDPAALISRAAEPLAAILAAAAAPKTGRSNRDSEIILPLGKVVEVLEGFETLLGVPDGCQASGNKPPCATAPSRLAELIRSAVRPLVQEAEGRIAELVVRLIEQPDFRLAGAEETLRQFSEIVQQALVNQEELTRELQERSANLYNRIQVLVGNPDKKTGKESSWSPSVSRRSTARQTQHALELLDALQAYPKCRFQSLVLQQVNSFYVSLRGQLSDQLREVDFCRGRLSELALRLQEEKDRTKARADAPSGTGQLLLPEGCPTVEAVVERTLHQVSPEDFIALDHRVETMIRKQFRALVYVCMASSSIVRSLVPQLLGETQNFLQGRLPSADAVRMYLDKFRPPVAPDQPPDEAAVSQALLTAYDEAQPSLLGSTDEDSVCILATPDSPDAEELRRLARQTLPRTRVHFAPSLDEIVLYREQLHAKLAALARLTRQTRPAYEQMARHEHLTPHSRLDIAQWATLGS
jgi:serine/threonine protein kinase